MTAAGTEMAWTPLSARLGIARSARQRNQILTAVARMHWTADIDRYLAHMDGEAARAIVAAVYHHRRDQLALAGVAALPGSRQLVGMQDAAGSRTYLLDLGAEAIHVLAEVPTPTPGVA